MKDFLTYEKNTMTIMNVGLTKENGSPTVLNIQFGITEASNSTHIVRPYGFHHWNLLGEIPSWLAYDGPEYIVFNTELQCAKEIQRPIKRTSSESC